MSIPGRFESQIVIITCSSVWLLQCQSGMEKRGSNRLFSLVLPLLFLAACGQNTGSDALNSPALATTSLHDDDVAQISSQSIQLQSPQGLWQLGPLTEDGTEYTDRVRVSENVTLYSRKCTFEDATVLIAETIVLSRIEGSRLVLEEDIDVSKELGKWACKVEIVKDSYPFVPNEETGGALLLEEQFEKISQ